MIIQMPLQSEQNCLLLYITLEGIYSMCLMKSLGIEPRRVYLMHYAPNIPYNDNIHGNHTYINPIYE